MIIRYAGHLTHVKQLTPQVVRKIFDIQDARNKLTANLQELARESANGPSLALRRLKEKVARQERRLTRLGNEILRIAPANKSRKARS